MVVGGERHENGSGVTRGREWCAGQAGAVAVGHGDKNGAFMYTNWSATKPFKEVNSCSFAGSTCSAVHPVFVNIRGAAAYRLLRTNFHRQPIDASIRHRSAENRPRWSHRRSHRNDKSDGNWEQMWSATPVAGILRASSRAPGSAAAHVRVCHAAVLLDDADRAQRGGQVQRRSVPCASPGFDLAVRARRRREKHRAARATATDAVGRGGAGVDGGTSQAQIWVGPAKYGVVRSRRADGAAAEAAATTRRAEA